MLKKVLLVVIIALVMAAGWFLQSNLGLERTFLSPRFYGAVIEEADKKDLQDYFLATASPRPESDVPREELLIYRFLVKTAEENWLKDQAAHAAGEGILFLKGEQDQLVISFDLQARREVLLEDLEKNLQDYFPEEMAERAPEFLEGLLNRFDIPEEMILVEIEDPGELSSEFRAQREGLNQARFYLRYLPWIAGAVLALAGFIWLGTGRTFTALGLGLLLSGGSYYFLWPSGWDNLLVPFFEGLAADYSLLALIWARQGQLIFGLVENTFNRIATYFTVGGAMLLTFGLFVTACSRFISRGKKN